MHITDQGLLALARHEGLVPAPYLDSVGVWTFGIGHTAAAGNPDPAKMPRCLPGNLDAGIQRALDLFRSDLKRYEDAVRRAVQVPLESHEFDALVSFHFNTGGIAKAALTRHLNSGDRKKAAQAFLNWRRPKEIIPRREAEQRLFRDGIYPSGALPVWSVDASGRVDFSRPVRSLGAQEALAMLRSDPPPKPSTPQEPERSWLARLLTHLTTILQRT